MKVDSAGQAMAPPWSPCALVTTEPKPTTRPGHLEGQGMGAAQTTFILLVLPIARQAGSGQLHVSHVGRVWTSLTGRAAAPTSPKPPSMPSPPPLAHSSWRPRWSQAGDCYAEGHACSQPTSQLSSPYWGSNAMLGPWARGRETWPPWQVSPPHPETTSEPKSY